jgi:hypothetical protein
MMLLWKRLLRVFRRCRSPSGACSCAVCSARLLLLAGGCDGGGGGGGRGNSAVADGESWLLLLRTAAVCTQTHNTSIARRSYEDCAGREVCMTLNTLYMRYEQFLTFLLIYETKLFEFVFSAFARAYN